eukprot:m.55117 g.55117  ORF g.55117 m.55117 type:complete len:130 (-) comp16860_c0_seq1:260-649(-)
MGRLCPTVPTETDLSLNHTHEDTLDGVETRDCGQSVLASNGDECSSFVTSYAAPRINDSVVNRNNPRLHGTACQPTRASTSRHSTVHCESVAADSPCCCSRACKPSMSTHPPPQLSLAAAERSAPMHTF